MKHKHISLLYHKHSRTQWNKTYFTIISINTAGLQQNIFHYYIINTAGLQQNKTDFTIIS